MANRTADGGSPWRDARLPVADRVGALLSAMTLREKLAQLVGVWVGADPEGGDVAPHQSELTGDPVDWTEVISAGLGQLTRPFGTRPVDPVLGARSLASAQEQITAASRFGIPALVHEECLTGFAAWRATAHPAPLSWGASFRPELVRAMAGRIGASMRAAGVHQGLAPVLDVTRDYRWGRTEETIGEDPLLVGVVATAYVRGLEDAGVVATLKHFAGYSASRAGRNLGPVSIGPRELADVVLPPFAMAVRDGGARSVMNSYSELDGVPSAADAGLLTGLLREGWGFTGTVVADYFSIKFLQTLHGVAGDEEQAAALALRAGIDVELPTVRCYGEPLLRAVSRGDVPEELVDRAVRRVLAQKAELGLLDPDWSPLPESVDSLELDDAGSRTIALELARESVVLLADGGGALPLRPSARVALVGPLADDPMAMLGCYSFPAHIGVHHPDAGLGLEIPTVRDGLRGLGVEVAHAVGCAVDGDDRSGFADAVAAARDADVCVVAVGDRAGLFGRGTSGEGCDATDLTLPGVQAKLVREVLATGTPVVLLLITGRPYAVGELVAGSAAAVQAFFPGQLGGRAIAEVLTGAVNPSGRLPVSIPADPSGQPGTYLSAPLGRRTGVSTVDPTPAFPFGHGLSYGGFTWSKPVVSAAEWPVDGEVRVELEVRNTGGVDGSDVVQLYLHDPVASVTRPVVRLVGFAKVDLVAGAAARVVLAVPADVAAFTGLDGRVVVEPGEIRLRVSRSSADVHGELVVDLVGGVREVAHATRRWTATALVEPVRSGGAPERVEPAGSGGAPGALAGAAAGEAAGA
ncbi:glycoside hydrolase family 3 C-terminal domain-containing protein [Actinosynnema pretiosum subsp. pretiosum]|uniref:Glycoside hydrolase family 3 C-terminal domain-containing protein n=1 Tax=Actinosynnema pretiosum subsp. pretiosum TaxID=103721 RepID=A0AA45LAI4_9PSEU|nr:Beta-glucosidase [Actinosynnema pretiosum subsp. pretiosum]QUF06397.1 glycoside hydrolase family 3 C-terminal domain-containing protein [Actinosynnema pretiosum subsp. pretiosum]